MLMFTKSSTLAGCHVFDGGGGGVEDGEDESASLGILGNVVLRA